MSFTYGGRLTFELFCGILAQRLCRMLFGNFLFCIFMRAHESNIFSVNKVFSN